MSREVIEGNARRQLALDVIAEIAGHRGLDADHRLVTIRVILRVLSEVEVT